MASAKTVRNPIVLGYHACVRAVMWLVLVDLSLMAVSKHPWVQALVFLCWGVVFYFRVLKPFVRFMLPAKVTQKPAQGAAEKAEAQKAAPKAEQAAQAAPPEARPEGTPSPKRKYAKSAVVVPFTKKS
ncbi:hypothetical protein HHL24_35340 [Paraburkholderia sp. RP-4-7]|uniref:Uncharacterized protein n=1 Tax=Paraburkholderia polaris TaxID=2728848 RepID=A0A848IQ93_9BURK|nr:hypothetical protein [Paraburkholderia polaris]NMM03166.1 hypothetical protein [Paraburkholderia polaris]